MVQALTWPDADGPDLLVDDGSDATFLIHEGTKWERVYKKTGDLPNPEEKQNKEYSILLSIIKKGILEGNTDKWTKMSKKLIGV